MQEVTCPRQGAQAKEASQMVVEHRLNVLEPLELGGCLVVVEDAGVEHQTSHRQSSDGQGHQLGFVGDAPGPPHMEETGGDLNAVEAGTHIAIKDFLAEHGPDHLRTGFHVRGVSQPAGVIGEAGAMEEGTAQPDEDDGQVTEVSREDLPADFLEVTGVAVEVVSVGVEVPNPGGGFGTFGQAAVEVPGLTEQFEGGRVVHPVDLGLGLPTLWWADGHRDVPRGTGSRWRSTLLTEPRRPEPVATTASWSHGIGGKAASAMGASRGRQTPDRGRDCLP